jgi:hypothetical protein
VRRRASVRENLALVVAGMIGLALAIIADQRGMPQKWHAAIVGTVVPFAVVILSYRRRWTYWSFWASWSICLALHSLIIWILFQYVLSGVQHLGTVFWFPVALIEVFVLIVAIKRVEDKLTGRREVVRLS